MVFAIYSCKMLINNKVGKYNIMLDKIIGSLIGLSVGDTLGAPYEFKTPPFSVSEDYIDGGCS